MPRFVNAPNLTNYVNAPSPLRRLRYFLDFNGTNSYAELETAFTPAGDFSVEVDFSIGSIPAGQEILIDSDADLKLKIGVNASNGAVAALVGNGSSWVFNSDSGISVCDGKLHRVKLSKIGSSYKIYLDNEIVASATSATAITPSVNVVGRQAGGSKYFGGVIANPVFTDLDTPANSLPFRLDRPTGNYELPVNNVFGADIATNGALLTTTGWTLFLCTTESTAEGTEVTPTGSEGGLYQDITSTGSIEASVEVTYATGTAYLRIYQTNNFGPEVRDIEITGIGTYKVAMAGTNNRIYLRVLNGGAARFKDLIVKSVSNALTYNNIAESKREQFKLVGATQFNNISPTPQQLPAVLEEP